MNKFQTPNDFDLAINYDNFKIKYVNVRELVQGGPVVGNILINEVLLSNKQFGGPLICYKQHIYLPMYSNKIFSSGFRLAKINLIDRSISPIGNTKNLIFLDYVKDGKIAFYEDMYKAKYCEIVF